LRKLLLKVLLGVGELLSSFDIGSFLVGKAITKQHNQIRTNRKPFSSIIGFTIKSDLLSELLRGFVSLPELPIRRSNVEEGNGSPIGGGHLEGQALSVEVRVALPVGSPVPRHGLPPTVRSLDRHRANRSGSAHIGDQNKLEV